MKPLRSRRSPVRVFVGALAASILGLAPAAAQSQATAPIGAPLPWAHDWKSACARAAAEKKPLLVVVMKDHEAGCERMLEKVYSDAEVRLRLSNFVLVPASTGTHTLIEVEQGGQRVQSCPQFAGALCSEHQAIERELHGRLVEPGREEVLAPQHLVLDSKGELLLRRPYEMRRQGFLEFLERGLALFADPEAASQPGVHSAVVQRLEDAIVKARDESARVQATRELLEEPSPERETALLDAIERVGGAANKEPIVRAAGYPEFKVWAPTIAKLLEAKEPWVRECAVVTLEEEGDAACGPALLALWEKEKDGETKKDLLRALGPCGGHRPEIRQLLLAQLEAQKDSWRSAAAMSLGSFTRGDAEVADALERRYAKEKSLTVKLAILFAFFQSGDPTQRERVETMTKSERDNDLVSFAGLVRGRLSGESAEPAGSPGGAPPGGPAGLRGFFGATRQFQRLVAPLYDDDKVVRNRIKDWKRPVKGGKGP